MQQHLLQNYFWVLSEQQIQFLCKKKFLQFLCDFSTSSEANTVKPTWLLKVLLLVENETTQKSICELKGKRTHLHKVPGKMDNRAQNGPYSQPCIQIETQRFKMKKSFQRKRNCFKHRSTPKVHSILEVISIFCLSQFFHIVFLVM